MLGHIAANLGGERQILVQRSRHNILESCYTHVVVAAGRRRWRRWWWCFCCCYCYWKSFLYFFFGWRGRESRRGQFKRLRLQLLRRGKSPFQSVDEGLQTFANAFQVLDSSRGLGFRLVICTRIWAK